jgi:flagellar hook-length control protein FliK
VKYVQISTIDIRIDGVERTHGGKKNGKEDAGAESAFAAFFANVQHDVQQKSTAKVVSPGSDGAIERADAVGADQQETAIGASGGQDAESKPATTTASAVQNAEGAAPDAEESGEPAIPSLKFVLVSGANQLRSHARYSVTAANGKALDAKLVMTGSQAAGAAVSNMNGAAISNMNVGDAVVQIATEEAPTAIEGLVTAPSAPVATPSSEAGTASIPLATALEAEVAVETKPPQAKATSELPAVDGGTDEDAAQPAPPVSTVSGASTSPDADSASQGDPNTSAKVPVSKAASHVVARTPGKTESPVNVKALPSASPPLQTTDVVDDLGSDDVTRAGNQSTTAGAAGNSSEVTPKPESQVVRNVTQLVSQDGAVIATQTTETRAEGAHAPGQGEVVVVERTTIQALPEQALRGVRFLTANGAHTMYIRLVPESLGEVRLEVTAANGEVSVKLASANAAVREILQTHAQGLQNAIAQDGPSAVRVTVTSDVSGNAWLSGNAQRQSGQHGGGAQHRQAASTSYHEPKQGLPAMPRREAAHAGNLNVYA